MRIAEVTIGLKRTIRHAKYCLSTPEVKLTANISDEKSQIDSVNELHNDALLVIEKLVEEEKAAYNRGDFDG
jgi:hypothetical protein